MGNLELYISLEIMWVVFLREGYDIARDYINNKKDKENECVSNVIDFEEFREKVKTP